MTNEKLTRKEARLTSSVRKLIRITRTKYSHDPEKGVLYLRSIDPKTLNLFDRRKVGREILARLMNADNWSHFEGIGKYDFQTKIGRTYNVEVKRDRSEQEKPERATEREYDEFSIAHRLMDGKYWKMMNNFRCANDLLEQSKGQKPTIAIEYCNDAGRRFEEDGAYDRAIKAYKQTLMLTENFTQSDEYKGVVSELAVLETRLKTASKAPKQFYGALGGLYSASDYEILERKYKNIKEKFEPYLSGSTISQLVDKIEKISSLIEARNRRKASILENVPYAFGNSPRGGAK